jgi:hypothetical protein
MPLPAMLRQYKTHKRRKSLTIRGHFEIQFSIQVKKQKHKII